MRVRRMLLSARRRPSQAALPLSVSPINSSSPMVTSSTRITDPVSSTLRSNLMDEVAQYAAAAGGVRALENRHQRTAEPGEPAARPAERSDRQPHVIHVIDLDHERLFPEHRMPCQRPVAEPGAAFRIFRPYHPAGRHHT